MGHAPSTWRPAGGASSAHTLNIYPCRRAGSRAATDSEACRERHRPGSVEARGNLSPVRGPIDDGVPFREHPQPEARISLRAGALTSFETITSSGPGNRVAGRPHDPVALASGAGAAVPEIASLHAVAAE